MLKARMGTKWAESSGLIPHLARRSSDGCGVEHTEDFLKGQKR